MEAIEDGLENLSLLNRTIQRRLCFQLGSMESEMRMQIENVARSAKEKGKKPSHRVPPLILLLSFHHSMETWKYTQSAALFHQTLISNEYEPSQRNFDELRLIGLQDLLVETVHSAAYIVLR